MPTTMTRKRPSTTRCHGIAKSAAKRQSAPAGVRRKRPKTQEEIDAWFIANADLIMAAARANAKELTGKDEL